MPANLSILIIIKFIKANNKAFKNLALPISWSFFACLGNYRIQHQKIFCLFLCSRVYLHGKKLKWYIHILSWDQTIKRPDWLGLLKTDNITTVENTHLIKLNLLLLRMHIHCKKTSQYFKSLKHYLKALYSNVKALWNII